MFNELLLTVNAEILEIARDAQNKINVLLNRFNVSCSLSLNYNLLDEQISTLPATSDIEQPKEIPIPKKKSGGRKKK